MCVGRRKSVIFVYAIEVKRSSAQNRLLQQLVVVVIFVVLIEVPWTTKELLRTYTNENEKGVKACQ